MKPVVGLDVDGTLAAYHQHFSEFAYHWLGRLDAEYPNPYPGTMPFYRWLGISKATYRQIKLGYRQSGLKRSMPVFMGAHELAAGLRRAGAEIAICSTRPYLHYSNIEPDLRTWLRRNRIRFDTMFLGEHKYRELRRAYGAGHVVGVLDDDPELIMRAESLGLQPILRSQPHNLHFDWSPTVDGLEEARLMLTERIKQWRADV